MFRCCQNNFLIAFGIEVEVLHMSSCAISTSTWNALCYCEVILLRWIEVIMEPRCGT